MSTFRLAESFVKMKGTTTLRPQRAYATALMAKANEHMAMIDAIWRRMRATEIKGDKSPERHRDD